MIDNQMKQADPLGAADIATCATKEANKDEPVSLDVLMRICNVFHCDIGDNCEVKSVQNNVHNDI